MKKITVPIVALLFFLDVTAQQAFTNTGNLQIHNGGSISGFGNFTNSAAAVFTDNGSVYIKGDLTNGQASMSAGTGTIYLNGTSAQSVSGTQTFKTNNLVTNNATGITLNVNLSVSGVHTFSAGNIASSATPNYMVYETGSSTTGSNDSRHITGWAKKIGNADFIFPVGDATYQRTISISNLTALAEINCHYYVTTQNIFNLTSPIVRVRASEYWQLDKISGGNMKVTLNWDHSKVAMDDIAMDDILVGRYSGTSWTDAGGATTATGVVTLTGSVTSNSIASLGPFTFGYKTFPVPLKLISFTAKRERGTSYLHWITENEQNVDHFDVERSYDAVNFSNIGKTNARNRSTQEHYFFEDHAQLKGNAWYRIRNVDVDGKFFYSKILMVSETDFFQKTFLIVSPARNSISVYNKSGDEGIFNYRLLNPVGQVIIQGNIDVTNNGKVELLLPPQISAGIYYLEIKNSRIRFIQKVLIEK